MEHGGPSVTARRVAAHRLRFTRVPAAYGDPAADEALAADVAAGQDVRATRMHDYLAARTRFFDRVVTGALGRGVRQVVVGAAGYDGRAFRYAKPGVRWFEADHPATQRDKRERLERLGLAAPHLRFVEADFTTDPVADRLLAAGLDPEAPSLFLLEGVAVYLEPAVLETVLDQFGRVAAAGSRLAISVSLSRAHDAGARARFRASVAALGEPARSSFDTDEAEALLARTGWRIMTGEDAARGERLRSAGLLLAGAAPRILPAPRGSRSPRSLPTRQVPESPQPRHARRPQRSLPLPALLSQALVAFTIEWDNEAEHRLPHADWALGILVRRRLAVTGPDPAASRGTVARLTRQGLDARRAHHELVGAIEQRWRERFSARAITALRAVMEPLATSADGQPPLFRALEPYPDNWRARLRPPVTLPRYPMVLHRGGYPDGS